VGVFGYSDEDGTEAQTHGGKLDAETIAERVVALTGLVEQLTAQRAEERIGEVVSVLVEEVEQDGEVVGRAEQQGPDVDGVTILTGMPSATVGEIVPAARVVATEGVDLVARPLGVEEPAGR